MITLKQWMELVDYKITEGSTYGWQCYGYNAYTLDSWDGDHDGSSFSIIFDTRTHEVYEVQAHDFKNQRAYRIINPEFAAVHLAETSSRGVVDEAWEDVDYVDLETDSDWLEKASAIAAGEEYDIRVSIPITLPDNEMLMLMTMAHERDMKFNDFVEEVLREQLAQLK